MFRKPDSPWVVFAIVVCAVMFVIGVLTVVGGMVTAQSKYSDAKQTADVMLHCTTIPCAP